MPDGEQMGNVDLNKAQDALPDQTKILEADDLAGITTVQEYSYVPMERLPKVDGVSNYAWDENTKTVEFPINMWIG